MDPAPYRNPLRKFSRNGRKRRYDWEALIEHGQMLICSRDRSYNKFAASLYIAARVQGLRISISPAYEAGPFNVRVTLAGRIAEEAKGYKSPRWRAEIAAKHAHKNSPLDTATPALLSDPCTYSPSHTTPTSQPPTRGAAAAPDAC